MKRTVAATLTKTCVCSVCNKKFASQRALAAHAQRVHGYRTDWSKRVDDSSVFPVCKATFHTRIRVPNHVRSSACRDEVVDLPGLPGEALEKYRKADAAEIRVAQPGRTNAARKSATSHIKDTHASGRESMDMILSECLNAVDEMTRHGGFALAQWVLSRLPRNPATMGSPLCYQVGDIVSYCREARPGEHGLHWSVGSR